MITQFSILEIGHTKSFEKFVHKQSQWRKIAFPSTICVFEHSKHGIFLFDTGYSPRFHDCTKNFPEKIYSILTPVFIDENETAIAQLKKLGISNKDVSKIFLSHFHADHIGGVRDFPYSHFIYHQECLNIIQQKNSFKNLINGFLPNLLPNDFSARSRILTKDKFKKSTLIDGFESICDYFNDGSLFIIPLPGHSAGHIGLYFECNGKNLFLIGDAVWLIDNLKENSPPPFLTRLFMGSTKQYLQTFDNLRTIYHKGAHNVQIVPCHCTKTLSQIQI